MLDEGENDQMWRTEWLWQWSDQFDRRAIVRFFMIFIGGMSEKMYKMLLIGLYSRWPARVPILTPDHHWKHLQWAQASKLDLGAMEEGYMVRWVAFYVRYVYTIYLGTWWHKDALWEKDKPIEEVWCASQCSTGKPWVWAVAWTSIWHVPPT